MKPCYVCTSPLGAHEHHVVPQAKGGREGPLVNLCPTCHDRVHRIANREVAGKSGDEYMVDLEYEAQRRLLGLVRAVLVAHTVREDKANPNPMMAVRLKHHAYLTAMHMLKKDRGYTNLDDLLNAMCHAVARQYGLVK